MYQDQATLLAEQTSLQKQLRTYRQNLLYLEEQKAIYGGINVPLNIINGIANIEIEIEELETRLTEIGEALAEFEAVEAEAEAKAEVESGEKVASEETAFAQAEEEIESADLMALKDALKRGTLTLFIGADFPQTVTGLPSRTELGRELARSKGLPDTLSLAEAAQRVSRGGNRFEHIVFLRDRLDTSGKAIPPLYRRIAQLAGQYRLETIITTAYHTLLERAFQQSGVPFNTVTRGGDLTFINPEQPTLLKLYGDLQQPDTLIVTEEDHTALLRDREREAILDEIQRAFRRNTVLFLGYNLSDFGFRFIYDQVAQSSFSRRAYAVWPNLPLAEIEMWRDRNIQILAGDPLPQLI